jgi:hypothetical protein
MKHLYKLTNIIHFKSTIGIAIFIFSLSLLFPVLIHAQNDRKVNFVGSARALLNSNNLTVTDSFPDSLTIKKRDGGYALIDLGVNIKPNKNTEILGMFRIRNEYGGFWGSGVAFDVRQLWVKGIFANSVRYQIGDINLKQTPFTLYNHHADQIDSMPLIFGIQQSIVNYDRFYMNNNTWRMQGANVDFGFSFSKIIKEINFSGLITRLNASNFTTIPDRLMSGYSIDLVQSKYFALGFNNNLVFDVKGTIPDSNMFNNMVNTINIKLKKEIGKDLASIAGEVGQSKYAYTQDTLAPTYKDYFIHAYAKYHLTKYNLELTAGYLNVGPDFRSIGAQSKDVNYNAAPSYFNRYGNDQALRPISLFDIVGNENIYNRTVSSVLAPTNQLFNNVLPNGIATYNRVGAYGKLDYKTKKNINIHAAYFNLAEIRGQGSLALKKFEMYKLNMSLPIHQLINSKKVLSIQLGTNIQKTNRKSAENIENIDLETIQYTAGIRWEIFKNFDFLAGTIKQVSKGNEFAPDRNTYSEIIYFQSNQYELSQQISALGIRYNFSPKSHLTVLLQENKYLDNKNTTADYSFNQFGIIYIISL